MDKGEIKKEIVRDVFIFPNGNVVVTDEKGEMITRLQGRWIERAKDIYKEADSLTLWYDSRIKKNKEK